MKRLLIFTTLLLCSLLTFAQFTGTVSDSQGVKYTANYDESTCYVSGHENTYSATITIPEIFGGRRVTSIGRDAFIDCGGLTSLTIPEGVTSIGDFAFFSCRGLTSVAVGWETPLGIDGSVFDNSNNNNVTLYVPKGTKAAYEAANVWKEFGTLVEMLDISDGAVSDSQGVRYTANDDESTCYVSGHDDTYNSDIIIPNSFKGRHVTSIGTGAFFGCSNLTSLSVKWGTPIAIDGSVFEDSNCHNAVLRVPLGSKAAYDVAEGWSNFGEIVEVFTEGQKSDSQGVIYRAYYDDEPKCRVVGHEDTYSSTIIIPEFYEGSRVTSIGYSAFQGCSSLTSVKIPEGVTSIGDNAFYSCSGLTSLTIPSSVTSIGDWAFINCSNLTSVVIPEGVISIGEKAFQSCKSLTSVTIPSSVKSMGLDVFERCSGLTSISIESGNTVYDSRENCNAIIRTADNTLITGCMNTVIPSSVTSIDRGAFYECSGLTSLTIPSNVTEIGHRAFYNNSGLTSIVVEDGNTVYDSRNNCNAIIKTSDNTLIQGCMNTVIPSNVTSIDQEAFYGCSGLTSLTIPSSVTLIGFMAFEDCSGLTSIIVEDGNTVYDSRNNCNAIIKTSDNTLIRGCTSTVIPSNVVSLDHYAFTGCSALTSIMIPSSVTSIGSQVFADCNGLTSIVVEEGNTVYDSRDNCNAIIRTADNTLVSGSMNSRIPTSVTSIEGSAFWGCSGMTSLTIPEGVTSIGYMAFQRCNGLTSLTIPSSVMSIDHEAFDNCSSLTSVIVGWDTPLEIHRNVFEWSNYQNATLYVPKGTKTAYEAAAVWQDFGSIEEYEKPQENIELTDASAIENVIYMEPIEATKGQETTVSLKMKNTADIRGFQFDMQLPLGVTVAKDANNRPVAALNSRRLPEGSAHTLTVSEQADGSVRFLCASQYDETFTGSDGEILTVRLCLDPHMLDGQYPVVLKDVTLSETNISNFYKTETVQTALTVISYIPGDISGDGEIDVSDYIGVANYIHGNTPAGFVAAAADVNKDNTVDVLDYIGIANLILYNSVYGNTNASRRAQRRGVTDVSLLDNVIYLEPFAAEPGGEVQLKLKMKNTAAIRGFQFDLYLPEGMTAKKYANGRIVSSLNDDRRPDGDEHTLTLSERPDGAIRFLCGSQYDETFTGSDGEIATLTINVSADMEEADYPVYLRHVKLTETDISKYYLTEEIETTAMVMNSPWLPGDATEDGDVNVTDIMAVANWILKIKMDKFNLLAADVNGDGDINVTDIMGIANIILKVTPSSNSRATSVADAVEPQ